MISKDRFSDILAVNATGCVKEPLRFIGHKKQPKFFLLRPCLLHYKPQTNSRSDETRFSSWFQAHFFRHVNRATNEKFMLPMDNCGSKGGIRDPLGQVRIACFPLGVTSVHKPLDQGIIDNQKRRYRHEIFRRFHEGADDRTRPRELN